MACVITLRKEATRQQWQAGDDRKLDQEHDAERNQPRFLEDLRAGREIGKQLHVAAAQHRLVWRPLAADPFAVR